jgi:RNA polymerase sigma factor (TIGR02999 family)
MTDITRILTAIDKGDPDAAAELLPVVYDELRALATRRLVRETPGQTLQATALVHEAYLRLVGTSDGVCWDSRGHFFAAAAESMRRILIERARAKNREKRGGPDHRRVEAELAEIADESRSDELLALDEALGKLAQEDAQKAELVKLRYFAGLTLNEIAALMGISRATAHRYWSYARVWLYCEIRGEPHLNS